MTDRERGFLDAVLADPSDDFPRLVMADWLEDEGRVERAEFIRLQCRMEVIRKTCLCGSCVKQRGGGQHTNGPCGIDQERDELPGWRSKKAMLRWRERELLEENCNENWPARHWLGLPGHFIAGVDWSCGCRLMLSPVDSAGEVLPGGNFADVRRGFVASVSLTLADFMMHAKAIFAAAPVEEVTIIDRHQGHDARGYQGWWGTDDLVVGGDNIPLRLHAFLPPSPFWQRGPEDKWAWYHSEAEAHAALSCAAVAYGRDKAGLPAPPTKEAVSR